MTWLVVSLLLALPLLVTWSYRGGSIPGQQSWGFVGNSRPLTLLSTPLFIALSSWAVLHPFNMHEWLLFGAGIALFFAVQTPGWGAQMDLGRHWGKDDEWGHQIRDWIFGKEKPLLDAFGNPRRKNGQDMIQGNYKRDLFGLFMRMLWFIIPAIPWYFVHPLLALVPLSMLLSPMIWNYEYKNIILKGKQPTNEVPFGGVIGHSWVEFYIGVMLMIVTAAVNTLIYMA